MARRETLTVCTSSLKDARLKETTKVNSFWRKPGENTTGWPNLALVPAWNFFPRSNLRAKGTIFKREVATRAGVATVRDCVAAGAGVAVGARRVVR